MIILSDYDGLKGKSIGRRPNNKLQNIFGEKLVMKQKRSQRKESIIILQYE